MSKTITQLITQLKPGKNKGWAVVNEKGELIEEFRLKTTANQWLPKLELKFNTDQKLKVIEITD